MHKGLIASAPARPPTWAEWKPWIEKRGWWLYPLARAEWASEWVYYGLRSLALFDLLELAGRCTVLVIAILWVLEADDRAKQRHYRAWELINAAAGKAGDGGRKDALQDLNRDGVRLNAAPLEKAYLPYVDLKGAALRGANLQDAQLQGARLQRANLENVQLQRANLWGAKLHGAHLWGANLQGADLVYADLQGARLWSADLQGADLGGANLQDADLTSGPFGLRLDTETNLLGVRNLTQKQLDAAKGDDRTVLPAGLTRPAHWSKFKSGED